MGMGGVRGGGKLQEAGRRRDVAAGCGTDSSSQSRARKLRLQSPRCPSCLQISSGQMLSENQFKRYLSRGAFLYPLPSHLTPLSFVHHGPVFALPEWPSPLSPASCLLPTPASPQRCHPLPSSPRF